MAKRVLIVDDEPQIRDLLTRVFTKGGYVVDAAESGERALELMRASPAWVAFLDLQLPGMDGVELCRAIRREWPLAIAHAMTGYASLYGLYDCREAGFEDLFTKPVEIAALLAAAEYAFGKIERWKRW